MGAVSPHHKIFGVGINDIPDFCLDKCYTVWHSMLRRSYSEVYKLRKPTYWDVYTEEQWHRLSKFKAWFDVNYINGYELDKDILVPGNRMYGEETCCFIPQQINSALIKTKSSTDLPLGVSIKKHTGKYIAQMSTITEDGKRIGVHLGSFTNPEAASQAYKQGKESYIKELAERWKSVISLRAYEGLINYKVLG